MKKTLIAGIALLLSLPAIAQVSNPSIILVGSAPSGSCTANLPDEQVITLGTLYSCQSGTWTEISGGGGGGFTPGGDLSGSSTSQEVVGLLSSALPTLATGYLNYTGTAWALSALPAAAAGSLTGTALASNVVTSSLTSAAGGSFGTAAYVATGTSGANIPLLNGANTWSANQAVSTPVGSAVAASPSWTWGGVYEATSGPTYAADLWAFQDVVGTGVNGSSFLTLTHSGTTSTLTGLGIPNGSAYQIGTGCMWGATSTTSFYMGNCTTQFNTSWTLNVGTVSVTTAKASAYTQSAASSTGGTCSMSTATSCTQTIGHTYTTPVCIATQQGTGAVAGSCGVSGTTVTVTAASSNTATWGFWVFGNPT